MQGLSDGYFVIPYTLGHYLASEAPPKISIERDEFKLAAHEAQEKIDKILSVKGTKTVTEFHKDLGHIMWNQVGMGRTREGLKQAIADVSNLREEFWQNVRVTGEQNNLNFQLEHASRVADFLNLAN